jgi:hypothetical protein
MKFFPLEPRSHEILLMDIAHALSLVNRFGGHTVRPYSVAAHSLLVCDLLPPPLKLQGLMHDAAEAYVGDIVSPIKSQLLDFKLLEKIVWVVICERFNLPFHLDPLVKQADLFALKVERDALINNHFHWPVDDRVFPQWELGWRVREYDTTQAAERDFTKRFYHLAPFVDNPAEDESLVQSKPISTNTNT